MTQMPLDFNAPLPTPEVPEVKLETLTTQELEQRYLENVGKDPRHRFLDVTENERREYLIEGIKSKESALDRLVQIDATDDHEQKKKHWSN